MIIRSNAKRIPLIFCMLFVISTALQARQYHVSASGGDDKNKGAAKTPFKTISRAARAAQPGDAIMVHAGTYRERVNPPRGGESDRQRIVYMASPGEEVIIKGSETIRGWRKVQNDTWTVTIPNSFFGDFNPYSDLINGDWFGSKGRNHHTGAVYLNGHWLTEAADIDDVHRPVAETPLWFGQVDETNTTIWAQFRGINPNEADVEINVRRAVFYPDRPGVNFITVCGFTMMHAATPWAPPTAEQIGLIGTHWSKGWIIEKNNISYSVCVGVTLGKYGDQWDNTSQNTAEGYVKTIERALENGWSRKNIGNHIVRNNRISHCEQAGIVGSMGAVFSSITDNVVHDIHIRRLFTGAEMAGIKIHAAIDTEIRHNHIYRTCRGIWLDWMAQGARVTGNLLHDNNTCEDLFLEVNHGPFLIDNNIFLSGRSLSDWSQGGAYVHNLFAGSIRPHPELNRETPFHEAHTTEVAGLQNIKGGDDRFYNNLFIRPAGLDGYDKAAMSVEAEGNVYYSGAKSRFTETNFIENTEFDPHLELVEDGDSVFVRITMDDYFHALDTPLVTTALLGRAKIPNVTYENPDGSPLTVDTDYFGKKRNSTAPSPGPFENPQKGRLRLKVR
ncbi:MAG: right-handed parallel beta-helix repeat-containing protein [Sedimentisphaerales bacterium]|nr:right-handed parallel beta-helix repeat-containing protein [Sedimentisphaerales bacterium]